MAKRFGPEANQNQQKAWLYLKKMGFSQENWVHLVPSRDASQIVFGSGEFSRRPTVGNAVIVTKKNAVLSLFPADCYPIFITDKTYSFLALVHGSLAAVKKGRIVERTIETALLKSDFGLDGVIVGIGPGIKKCCYRRGITKKNVDLLGMILQQLKGVPEKNISIAGVCTACGKWKDEFLFFSHQRSKAREPEGRFGAFVALNRGEP